MRIRSIKPEFWRSDDITGLSREHRLLFIGLWSYVDDNGVGVDDYRQIAADLFALEDDQKEVRDYVREGLATLSRDFLIVRYEVGGKRYLYVTGWKKHQRVDKPNKARYPEPPADFKPPTSENVPDEQPFATPSRDTPETPGPGTGEQRNRGTEEKGKNTAGKPAQPRAPRADRDPDGFADFWAAYPRRIAKRDAGKAYAAALKRGVEATELAAAARRYAAIAARMEPRFVPHPATWLNQGRYEDEPTAALAHVVNGSGPPPRVPTTTQRVRDALALLDPEGD